MHTPKWHQMASDGPMPPHYPEVTQILVHFLFPGQGDLCGAESSHPAPVHRVRPWAHGAGVANDVVYRQVVVGACRCLEVVVLVGACGCLLVLVGASRCL